MLRNAAQQVPRLEGGSGVKSVTTTLLLWHLAYGDTTADQGVTGFAAETAVHLQQTIANAWLSGNAVHPCAVLLAWLVVRWPPSP